MGVGAGPSPPNRMGVSFSAIDPRLTETLLPEALRARYMVTFFSGMQGGLDVALAAKLFRSKEDMREMADALMAARSAQEEACARRYIAFAAAERAAAAARAPTAMEQFTGVAATARGADDTLWPAFAFHHPTDSLLHPTNDNLTTAIKQLHRKLQPYLLGDLVRRAPGEFASSDGTFRLAMRTISDAGTLLFILGERHDIVAWYALKSESWAELYAGLLRLRRRLERLGQLHKLKFWYDDRCCNGCHATKITEHVLVYLFPGISRCPYKDRFHACNIVTKTLHDGTPEGKSEFASEVGAILCQVHEPDVETVATYLRNKRPALGEAGSRVEAKRSYRRDGIIRTFGPSPSVLVNNEGTGMWQLCASKWRERKRKAVAERARICIRSQTHELTGTVEAMDTLGECLAKGCCSDPLPVEQMYIDLKQQTLTRLMVRKHKGDTGKNEVTHRMLNQLVEHVSRMSEELMGDRLDFLVFMHNEMIDKSFGLLDAHAHGLSWVAVTLNVAAAGVLEVPLFPALTDTHVTPFKLPPLKPIYDGDVEWEPMGFIYLSHEKNVADRAIVERVIAEHTTAAAANATTAHATTATTTATTVITTDPATTTVTAAIAANPITAVIATPITAAAANTAIASPSSPISPTGRQGGRRWSGSPKGRTRTAADLPAIAPSQPNELQLMSNALTRAREEGGGAKTAQTYDRAADLYFIEVSRLHLSPDSDPPADPRPNPTSGARIKALYETSLKRSRAVALERGDESDGGGGGGDGGAFDDDHDDDCTGGGEAPDAADAAERKRRRKERQRTSNVTAAEVARALVFETKRPLSLEDCSGMGVEKLSQRVLRMYVEAAQGIVGKRGIGKEGTPAQLCARLAALMTDGHIASPFVAP
jgi:hypothetical protein